MTDNKLDVIFMGTPEFAATVLQKLIETENVVAVFTQPDKPQGRKQVLTPPPVKVLANKYDIPVYQPKTLKDNAILAQLEEYKPDVIVVAAYGKILPQYVLSFPPKGCLNVHGSLLPKYRGAAPVQWAIINGEKETGITIMYMDVGLDTGDIIKTKSVEIGTYETYGQLLDRLSVIGADLLIDTLKETKKGEVSSIKQDDSKATFAPQLDKTIAKIDFNKSAQQVVNLIHGLNPWPVAYTYYLGKKLKVFNALLGKNSSLPVGSAKATDDKCGIEVTCNDNNTVIFTNVQLEGNRQMSAKDFLMGHSVDDIVFN